MGKKNNRTKQKKNGELLFIDEAISIHRKKGNGVLRRQIWKSKAGEVTRYSLAYINYQLFQDDNGRVLGYDNAHGYHHQHYLGEIKSINFKNFEEIEKRFQEEFEVLHEKAKKTR